MIAITVLTTAMVGIGSVLGTQMLSVTSSSTWKVATDLLNQAMEEVRALPDSTLASGITDLTSCDSSVPGGTTPDANIKTSGTTWTFAPNNETIPHGDLACTGSQPATIPPLIPHQTKTTLNHLTFTVGVYPTIPSGLATGILRVTAIVSWKRIGLVGVHQLSAQTLVYPTTCIAPGNNAYAGPCQPLISAGAGANTGGSIQVTGTIAGVTFDQMIEVLPQATSSMQIQQISTVSGCAITSGGQYFVAGAGQSPAGQSKACSAADNDPASTSTWQTKSTGAQTSQSLVLTGTLADNLGLSETAGDTGTSTSTIAATGSPPAGAQTCTDLAGTAQTSKQPCGASAVTSGGSATLSATLFSSLLGGLGSVPLLSSGASTSPAGTFVGRYTLSGQSATYCATPVKTVDDGCVHAGASRSFGLLELAGLPSSTLSGALAVAPVGWGAGSANCPAGNYLVALTNYSDSAAAESGIDGAAPATATSGTPYLCYWNGTGYSSTSASLGSTSPALPINSGSFNFTNLAGTLSVSITSNLFLGTATTASTPSPWAANTASGCWQVPCTARATVTSPIQGSYQIAVSAANVLGGPLVSIANLTVSIDLGELTASSSYQAAPPQP